MSKLGNRLRKIPKELMQAVAVAAAPAIENAIKADAPVLTGVYKESLYVHNVGTTFAIGSALRYAKFIESKTDVKAVIARVVREVRLAI